MEGKRQAAGYVREGGRSLGKQGWARGGEDACVGPGRRGLSCRSLSSVTPVVVTTSSRRRRERRVFKSSAARPRIITEFSLSFSLHLPLSTPHLFFSLFLSHIPFLPVIFTAVFACQLARARARACQHVVALAPRFKSPTSSRRGCRRSRLSSADEHFRVCARRRPMGDRTRVISRGGATEEWLRLASFVTAEIGRRGLGQVREWPRDHPSYHRVVTVGCARPPPQRCSMIAHRVATSGRASTPWIARYRTSECNR